jgi:hypothetical protein
LPARYVPPAGFGYPLDGLLHPSPCRACFVPAALLGFALRSLLLLKGIRAFPRGRAHVPFLPAVSPAAEAEGRPTGPRFLGFNPFRSPVATGHVISAPTAGCSLGLRPSRVFRRNAPAGPSPDRLSRASVSLSERQQHRRPRVCYASTWIRPRSRQAGPPDESTRLGFRHRYDSGHSSAPPPGL